MNLEVINSYASFQILNEQLEIYKLHPRNLKKGTENCHFKGSLPFPRPILFCIQPLLFGRVQFVPIGRSRLGELLQGADAVLWEERTRRVWKSPFFLVNSIKMVDFPWRFLLVIVQECSWDAGYWVWLAEMSVMWKNQVCRWFLFISLY